MIFKAGKTYLMAASMSLLLLAGLNNVNARTYYVDANDGMDANSGSSKNPWQTLSKVNSYNFRPGDTILLKRGSVWKENLVVPTSGTSKKPLTFGAYGNGARPLLDGLINISFTPDTWHCARSLSDADCTGEKKIWYLNLADYQSTTAGYRMTIYELNGVQEKMIRRSRSSVTGTIDLSNHEFATTFLNSEWLLGGPGATTLYIRSDEGEPNEAENRIIRVASGSFTSMIDTNYMDHIVIENLAVRGAVAGAFNEIQGISRGLSGTSSILIKDSSNITIRNNEVYFGLTGIGSSNSYADKYDENGNFLFVQYDANNSLIENNDVHDNAQAGIYLHGSSSNNRISSNKVHHNYNKQELTGDLLAIGLSGGDDYENRSNNVIEYNDIYENGTWGMSKDPAIAIYQSFRTIVRYNNIHDNNQGAFYFAFNTHESVFHHNQVHHNQFKNDILLRLGNGLSNNNNIIANNTIHANSLSVDKNKNTNSYFAMLVIDPQSKYGVVKNNIFSDNTIEVLESAAVGTRAFLVSAYERKGDAFEPITTRVLFGTNLYFNNQQIPAVDTDGNPVALWRFLSTTRNPGGDIENFSHEVNLFQEWASLVDPVNSQLLSVASISGNPAYVAPEMLPAPDFHLTNSSFAIDAGEWLVQFAEDYDGNPVPNGIAADIGAFEF